MTIAIVTDTACNITPEMAEEMGIYLLPIEITIDGQSYKDGYEMSASAFYEAMNTAENVPTTAQPLPSTAIELYKELSESYDEILSIHLGSNVSGTIQTLTLIGREFDSVEITVYDTQLVSMPAGYLVKEAKRMVDQGHTMPEITSRLDFLRGQSKAFASVHTLDHLVESGRVPSVVGTVAKLAKIKPILAIEAHEEKGFEVIEKVRTSKRVNKRLIELVKEYTADLDYPFHLDVAHGNVPEMAAEIKSQLEEVYPGREIDTHLLTSVIGAHSGPDIVGVFIAPDLSGE